MRKLAFLLIFLLFITACATIPMARDGIDRYGSQKQSNRGISIEFLQDQPPSEVFTDFNFWTGLKLTNYGKNGVFGVISVSDSAPDIFGGIMGIEEQSFFLDGADQVLDTRGNIQRLDAVSENLVFGPYQYNEQVIDNMKTTIRAELSYNYDFSINPQICIKGRLARSSDPRCSNNYVVSSNELGIEAGSAPIAVTRIEKNTLVGNENEANVKLAIFLQNSGNGYINNEDESIENIYVELVGSGSFKCIPSKISLKRDKPGEKSFTCILSTSINEDDLVEAPLSISFSYPYKVLITKTITIKSSSPEFID